MTNEAILDEQVIRNLEATFDEPVATAQEYTTNLEAAQKMEEQLDMATKEAEDAHTAYFALRDIDPTYDANKESKLWLEYTHAHKAKLAYLIGKIDGKKQVYDIQAMSFRDPNDYQEDDKVPADPQGQAEEDSYKS